MIQLKSYTYKITDYDKKGTVIIVPNSFNVEDDQGDISLEGSFTKAINENFGRWRYLWNHNSDIKIGEPLEAWQNKTGLNVKAVLNLNKDHGRNAYEDYKLAAEYGRGVEHSMKVAAVKFKGNSPRYVSEWKVQEFSYIPIWGANPETPLIALKNSDDQAFVNYCIKNGNHTDCYQKKLESLLEPSKTLETADIDQVNKFYNSLNFIKNGN